MSAFDRIMSGEAMLGVLTVAAYLLWLRPRLPGRSAWAVTACLALAGVAGIALAGPDRLALPLVVLLCGHAGMAALARARPHGTHRTHGSAADAVSTVDASSSPATAPRTLGRYRIEGELGRGAMGTVLLGRDVQNGQTVALKTFALQPALDGGGRVEARQRFRCEVDAARRLHHPDIVAVFDAGEEEGLAYFAMEALPGHDLRRHVQPPDLLPVPVLLRIAARVADALAHAHRLGVVHRDVKPANVIVDLAADGVKVADFGTARIAGHGRTRTGVVLGTPAYMSPEQLAGQLADARSDLYGLGVTLFQLLTGQLPHQSDSMAELMRQIARQPAPDLHSLRPELPQELAALVARLLDKVPDRRPSDGREVAAALRLLARQFEAAAGH